MGKIFMFMSYRFLFVLLFFFSTDNILSFAHE